MLSDSRFLGALRPDLGLGSWASQQPQLSAILIIAHLCFSAK